MATTLNKELAKAFLQWLQKHYGSVEKYHQELYYAFNHKYMPIESISLETVKNLIEKGYLSKDFYVKFIVNEVNNNRIFKGVNKDLNAEECLIRFVAINYGEKFSWEWNKFIISEDFQAAFKSVDEVQVIKPCKKKKGKK